MGFGKMCGLAVLSIVASTSVSQAATLVAHYQFEDTIGAGTVADSAPDSGGDNSGTLNGNATLIPVAGAPITAGPGLGGQALSLDGTGDYVNLTATSATILNGRSAFSIAAFVNVTNFVSGSGNTGDVFFVSNSSGAAAGRGVIQFINGATAPGGTIRAFARSYTPPATAETLGNVDENTANGAVAVGTWTHVAATFDIANNDILIYVNGVQVGLLTGQTFAATSIPSGAGLESLFVGLGANNAGAGEFFFGAMDDVRLYDGVLTPTEISELAVVPEPASIGMLAVGALALGRRKRRR